MGQVERRKFKRLLVRIPVTIKVEGDSKAYHGDALTLSKGGVYIRSDHGLKKGQAVAVEFDFEKTQLLRVQIPEDSDLPQPHTEEGHVSWVHTMTDQRFGIRFTKTSQLTLDFIEFLKSLVETKRVA